MATGLEWRRQRREQVQAGLAEPTSHGVTGYEQGCPCEKCRQANAARHARKRDRLARETPFELIPHGANGYSNYGCRCDDCTEGHRAERAQERENRASKAA